MANLRVEPTAPSLASLAPALRLTRDSLAIAIQEKEAFILLRFWATFPGGGWSSRRQEISGEEGCAGEGDLDAKGQVSLCFRAEGAAQSEGGIRRSGVSRLWRIRWQESFFRAGGRLRHL